MGPGGQARRRGGRHHGHGGAQAGRAHVPQEPDAAIPTRRRSGCATGPGATPSWPGCPRAVPPSCSGSSASPDATWHAATPGCWCSTWPSRAPAPSPRPSPTRAPTSRVLRMDRGDAIPPPDAVGDVAGLIVMGGPMSVHDDLAVAGRRARPAPPGGRGRPARPGRLPRGPAAGRRARRRGDCGAGARVRRR